MYPPEVIQCVRLAVAGLADVTEAIARARLAVRGMDGYATFVTQLVDAAVQGIVYDLRHQDNIRIRKARNDYGAPAKVEVGKSPIVRAVTSAYEYRIGGNVLGNLLGEELVPLAEQEEGLAAGHAVNARLLRELRTRVKNGQRVRDAVSEKLLRTRMSAILDELTGRDPAA
jgi:hypothetical protein